MAAGSNAQSRQGYTYSVPSAPWEESFGNHRAVLQVDQPDEVTALEFEWRRPDKDVDRKRYLIIHAETGDTVPNIKRLEVTEDHCRLLFGPVTQRVRTTSIICPIRCSRVEDSMAGATIRLRKHRNRNGPHKPQTARKCAPPR